MADELNQLPGVKWVDEETVRAEVAAVVTANASSEAHNEQATVKKALAKLKVAEEALKRHRQISMEERDEKSFSFQEERLKEAVAKHASALRSAQRELDRGKARRLAEALERQQGENRAPAAAAGPPYQQQKTEKKEEEVKVKTEEELAGPGLVVLHHRHSKPVQYPQVHPAHVAATGDNTRALQEYRGGDLLPAAHGVEVTAKERRRIRYMDDGDEAAFEARQERRKRHRREKREVSLPSSSSNSDSSSSSSSSSSSDESESEKSEEDEIIPLFQNFVLSRKILGRLLDYQRVGLRWLLELHLRRTGGILGDEMGLGKTVQIAAMLNSLLQSRQLIGPVLIVAPLTVLVQWVGEIHIWCPDIRCCILHATGSATCSKQELIHSVRGTPTVILTTYASATQNCLTLQEANFQYVILDEGHKISNPEAAVTIACKSFVTPHRRILTGSPIQNTLKELWCLFDFVAPGLLGHQAKFTAEFEQPIAQSKNPRASSVQLATAVECAKILRKHIAPYLLRRLKKDVNTMLPSKHERVIRCSLTDEQLKEYMELLLSTEVQDLIMRQMHANLDERRGLPLFNATAPAPYTFSTGFTDGMKQGAWKILGILRAICNHVDIVRVKREHQAEGGDGSYVSFRSNNPVNVEGSGKLIALKELLIGWKRDGHKALIFSQTRMMLDIIENLAEQSGYRYIRMDGTTPTKNRPILIDRFNSDPSIFIALLTTKVGGLGINLTGADRVVIFDPDWNPVTDEQARQRAWRLGQTREVCVYRMITSGTVEEHVLHRQLAKTYVTDKVLKDPTLQRFFSISSLTDAFFLGAEYKERIPKEHRAVLIAEHLGVTNEVDEELARRDDVENTQEAGDLSALMEGSDELERNLAPQAVALGTLEARQTLRRVLQSRQ